MQASSCSSSSSHSPLTPFTLHVTPEELLSRLNDLSFIEQDNGHAEPNDNNSSRAKTPATSSDSAADELDVIRVVQSAEDVVLETILSPRSTFEIVALPTGITFGKSPTGHYEIFKGLIEQVREYNILLNANVGNAPKCYVYNNYGLTPDGSISVKNKNVVFSVDGQKKSIPESCCFTDKKQVFVAQNTSLLADVAKATKNKKGYQCFTLADGCGWGQKAQMAAKIAAKVALKTLTDTFSRSQNDVTTKAVAQIQLQALLNAQAELVKEKAKNPDAHLVGDTTLTVATIASSHLVVTSVGDVKVFILRKRISGSIKCIDVTQNSRLASLDPTDCGGRLSPSGADWRNIAIATVKLEESDIILASSDGVHDNWDPIHRGSKLSDFDTSIEPGTKWDKTNPDHIKILKKQFKKNLISVCGDKVEEIADRVISDVSRITRKTKILMLEDPKFIPPKDDYVNYPGKDDHVSIVVFKFEPKKARGSFLIRK